MRDYDRPSVDLDALAAKRGMTCERPAANELFVDIDTNEQLMQFDRGMIALKAIHGAIEYTLHTSKTALHYHARVVLPFTVTPLERIAFQALLGSDPKREALALLRFRENVPGEDLSVFFEPA